MFVVCEVLPLQLLLCLHFVWHCEQFCFLGSLSVVGVCLFLQMGVAVVVVVVLLDNVVACSRSLGSLGQRLLLCLKGDVGLVCLMGCVDVVFLH